MNNEFRKAIEELEQLQEKQDKEIAETKRFLVRVAVGVALILFIVSLIQRSEGHAEALTALEVYLR